MESPHSRTFVLLILLTVGLGNVYADSEVTNTLDRLLSGYDKRVRPQFRFDPDVVFTTAIVHDIVPNHKSRSVTLSVTLTEHWEDRRLEYAASFNEIAIKELYDRVWLPDTIFHGAKEVRNTAGFTVVLQTTGSVSLTRRLVVTMGYHSHTGSYPFASDICKLRIRSESYADDQLQLNWTSHAVKWDPDIKHPGFDLETREPSREVVATMLGERFSELHISFVLKQKNSTFVVCLLGPLIFVLLSFASFWVSQRALYERYCYLIVLSIMQCTHATVMINRCEPSGVSTVTSLDIWEWVCCLFLLAVILETLVISHLLAAGAGPATKDGDASDEKAESTSQLKTATNGSCSRRLCIRLDVISRVAFPVTFITFTTIFWLTRHLN